MSYYSSGLITQDGQLIQNPPTLANGVRLHNADGSSVITSIDSILGFTPANDATVVHLAGTETITGQKNFSGGPRFLNDGTGVALYVQSGQAIRGEGGLFLDATTNPVKIRQNASTRLETTSTGVLVSNGTTLGTLQAATIKNPTNPVIIDGTEIQFTLNGGTPSIRYGGTALRPWNTLLGLTLGSATIPWSGVYTTFVDNPSAALTLGNTTNGFLTKSYGDFQGSTVTNSNWWRLQANNVVSGTFSLTNLNSGFAVLTANNNGSVSIGTQGTAQSTIGNATGGVSVPGVLSVPSVTITSSAIKTWYGYNSGSAVANQSAFGWYAGYLSTGNFQSAFGYQAGRENSGLNQSTFGLYSGYSNTGSSQSAFGYYAGYLNAGTNQSAVGYFSGRDNTGSSQSAFGYQSGRDNIGDNQSAFGVNAGNANTGSSQSIFGVNAGVGNSGASQSAFGYYAGNANTGSSQAAFGTYAGQGNIAASQSVFGFYAGQSNTGANQTAFGFQAGGQNTGAQQLALGAYAGYQNTANDCIFIGWQAGQGNTTPNRFELKQNNKNNTPLIAGDFVTGAVTIAGVLSVPSVTITSSSTKTSFGYSAGSSGNQSAFGYYAGYLNTGTNQSAFGYQAGRQNTGDFQAAFGLSAGYLNTGASQAAFGYYAGRENSGANQSVVGQQAGQQNIGDNQSALGHYSGQLNTAVQQTSVGAYSGYLNSGGYQSCFGAFAGRQNTGTNQTAVGYFAGRENTGAQQTALGVYAGYLNTADNCIFIGYQAGQSNATANRFELKQNNVNNTPLIAGDFSTGNVIVGGNISSIGGKVYVSYTPTSGGGSLEGIGASRVKLRGDQKIELHTLNTQRLGIESNGQVIINNSLTVGKSTAVATQFYVEKDGGADPLIVATFANSNATHSQGLSIRFETSPTKQISLVGSSGGGGLRYVMGSSGTMFEIENISGNVVVTNAIQVGVGGPKIKSSGTNMQIRNAADNNYGPLVCSLLVPNTGISFRSGASDPITTDLTSGYKTTWKNTTSGEIRDWVNDGGVMKKSAAYAA